MDLLIGLIVGVFLIFLFFPNAGKPRWQREAMRRAPLAEICWTSGNHHWTDWKEIDQLDTDVTFAGIPRLESLKRLPQNDLRYRYCGYCKDVDYTYWSPEKLEDAKNGES